MGKSSTPIKSISKPKLKKLIARDKELTAEIADKQTEQKRGREQITLYMKTNKLKKIEDTTSMRGVILIKKAKSEFIEDAFLKLTKVKLWSVCSPVMKLVSKLPEAETYFKTVPGDEYVKISDLKVEEKNVI